MSEDVLVSVGAEVTRSSVNAWEMGISVPSTQYIVELAHIFMVSTDYLLCLDRSAVVSIEGLTEKDVEMLQQMIAYMRAKNTTNADTTI